MMERNNMVIIMLVIVLIGVLAYYVRFVYPTLPVSASPINGVEVSALDVEAFNELYAMRPDEEFVVCLYGHVENDHVVVTNYVIPQDSLSTYNTVTLTSCDYMSGADRIVGTLHNHPNGVCLGSASDIYNFGYLRHNVMGIICGHDEFVFYTPYGLQDGTPLVVS